MSNVFDDVNRGGAAITAETIRLAQRLGDPITCVAITPTADLEDRSHNHTRASFPDAIFTGLAVVGTGRLSGVRSILRSIAMLAFPLKASGDAARRIRESGLVISKGGHVFVERRGVVSLMSFWATVFPLVYARRVGVPAVTAPTSIGPFNSFASRLLNRMVLSRLSLVVPRDPLSAGVARGLGIPERRICEMPDIVFGVRPPTVDETERICEHLGIGTGRFVTISPRGHSPALTSALVESSKLLLSKAEIDEVVVVNQAGDDHSASLLMEGLRDMQVVEAPSDLSPAELIALYAGSRLSIACRMHAAIFSLVAGTKALCVAFDGKKAEGVCQALNLPAEWVIHQSDAANLPRTAMDVMANPHWNKSVIMERVAEMRAALEGLPQRIEDAISAKH